VITALEIPEIDMVDQVWISEVMSNGDLGNKLGIASSLDKELGLMSCRAIASFE
jgi:hypothetical protein